jgi:hypothetical protein
MGRHRKKNAGYVGLLRINSHALVGHGFINIWTGSRAPEDIDRLIDAYDNLPGECGSWLFNVKFTSVAPA